MSRYGRISLSLMNCQMTRVISSPPSSTTGLAPLILDIALSPGLSCVGGCHAGAGVAMGMPGARALVSDLYRIGDRLPVRASDATSIAGQVPDAARARLAAGPQRREATI